MMRALQLAPGDRLEKYVLERPLGSGGMGAVWLAHDQDLDRKVALKVLRPVLANDETARARLIREARAMARLRHPNVMTVYDASSANGFDFVVMELVLGQNMASWLASAKREPQIVLAALVAAGRGLAAAHAAGMIHRDFKPHNVLVETGGRVLVTDFGLARSIEDAEDSVVPATDPGATLPGSPSGRRNQPSRPPVDPGDLDSPLTKTGHVLGTPAYMAPEQMAGERADERADQFAFCVTAWEALSGVRPFQGALTQDIANAIAAQQPVGGDNVPRRLRAVLRRGLDRDPDRRWRSMNHLVGAMVRAWKRPRMIAIGAAGAVALAGGAIAATLAIRDEPAIAPCGHGRDAIAETWSPKLREAFQRQHTLDTKDVILGDLDRWAAEWTTAFDGNCARPTDADFAARRVCLDGQREEVASLLSDVDAKVLESMRHVELGLLLPVAESCVRAPRAIAPPLPADPPQRARVIELRHALLRLELDAVPPAAYDDMAMRARKLVDDARAINYSPVEAEALVYLGVVRRNLVPATDLQAQLAAWSEARQLFANAAERAEAIGYDRVRTDALLGELEALVLMADQFESLTDTMRRAELAVSRLGDPSRELVLEVTRADIAYQQNLWSQAIELAARTRAAWRRRGSRTMVAKSALLEASAREQRHANSDLDEAATIVRDALALPLMPSDRTAMYHAAGRLALRRGKLDEARDAFAHGDTPYPELTAGGGDPNGGTITGTITGVEPGTMKDDISYTRRTLATVSIANGGLRFTVLADATGHFELAHVPPGRYTLTATASSSAGDMHGVRKKADVKAGATTDVAIDLPAPARLDVLTVEELELVEGIVIVLGGTTAVPKTPAGFLSAFQDASWFTAMAFDNANQAVLASPYTVCMVAGAVLDDAGAIDKLPTDIHCLRGQ